MSGEQESSAASHPKAPHGRLQFRSSLAVSDDVDSTMHGNRSVALMRALHEHAYSGREAGRTPSVNPLLLLQGNFRYGSGTSCSTPTPQPLSMLGPKAIGPVSCNISADSKNEPNYSSDAANLAAPGVIMPGIAGAVTGLIMIGIKETAEIPGQAALERISQSAGSPEHRLVLKHVRDQLKAAGYSIKPDAGNSFLVKITYYGMHNDFNNNTAPRIVGIGELRDSSGNLIWNSVPCTAYYEPARSFDTYKATPSQYRSDLDATAAVLGKLIVNSNGFFAKGRGPGPPAAGS